MNNLKITIVSYSWPPRNSISTHRPYSWARYWSDKGADVTVITAEKQSFDHPLDMNLRELKSVNVIQIPYEIFWAPLLSIPLKFSVIEKTGKWFRKRFINYLGPNYDPRNAWSLAASPVVSKIARESDVVISTYGPEASHKIGCKMKIINPKVYWIADYRDLWSENPSLIDAQKNLKKKIRNDELKIVGQYADLLTSVSDDMCNRLEKLHNKNSLKVPNGFDIDEKIVNENLSSQKVRLNKIFKISYTGSIYSKESSPIMLLEAIVNLIKKKKIPERSIKVEFYGARLDYIKELSQKSKYKDIINIKGHVPRTEVLEIQKKSDLLLLLASSEEISRGAQSGKIFEYMSAGRPIICIGAREDFEIGKILKSTKSGMVFENNEIKKLENLIYNSFCGDGIFKIYQPQKDEILNYSRKRIANIFLQEIKQRVLLKKTNTDISLKYSKKNNNKVPVITHIITGLERGGAERFLFNLLTNGLEGPFKNRVISLMSEGYYGPLLRQNNIPVSCLNLKRGSINFKAIKELRKNLKDNPPDIIQGWMYHGNLAALFGNFMTKMRSKLSWNIRLSLEIFAEMKFGTRLVIKLGNFLSKIPNLILYNSIRSINQHRQMGFDRNNDYCIPNGFDTNKWKPNEIIKSEIRQSLGISKDTKVIGYVGRGDEQKDLPNLFQAYEIVKKNNSKVILLAVGRNLKKYALNTDRIIFLDQRADVDKLMTSFDLLCLCSKAEGFPNVVGEAMSSGLPCVTTDVGDAKEIVGKTGWILPHSNHILLSKTLNEALNCSKEKLEKLGGIARTKIINNYSIDVVKNQYISLYKSILNTPVTD